MLQADMAGQDWDLRQHGVELEVFVGPSSVRRKQSSLIAATNWKNHITLAA
jgi:hypothetical protein